MRPIIASLALLATSPASAEVMSVRADKVAGGSRLTIDYRAAGFANASGATFAPMVDAMLGEQAKRFRAFAAGGEGRR